MAILAHRGITAVARDNSYPAIEAVAKAAAAGIPLGVEIDIRKTLDTLVMNHDPHFEGEVLASSDLALLAGLYGEKDLITLGVALSLVTDVPAVNLEIKEPAAVYGTVEETRRHCELTGRPVDQFVLSSFVPWVVRTLKRLAPEFATGCLVHSHLAVSRNAGAEFVLERLASSDMRLDPVTKWILNLFDHTDADYLHAHWSHACPRLFAELERRNKLVSFWTVDNERLLFELALRPEVAHVVTNFPHLVFNELRPTTTHRKQRIAEPAI